MTPEEKQIFLDIRNACVEGKIYYKKNAFKIDDRINLEFTVNHLNESEYISHIKHTTWGGRDNLNFKNVFSHNFHIYDVGRYGYFKALEEFMMSPFKNEFIFDRTDLFLSLIKTLGIMHVDEYNSLILGLWGKTIYTFADESIYVVEKGDILLSPTGKPHSGFALANRGVATWGMWLKKNGDK